MPSVEVNSDLADQLKAEESKLRYMMPDHIKELMSGKRCLESALRCGRKCSQISTRPKAEVVELKSWSWT